jgi:hypothetical protein
MTKNEIETHIKRKKEDSKYPSLPKFILNPKEKSSYDTKHQESCIRGFHKRLNNYNKTQIVIENNILL